MFKIDVGWCHTPKVDGALSPYSRGGIYWSIGKQSISASFWFLQRIWLRFQRLVRNKSGMSADFFFYIKQFAPCGISQSLEHRLTFIIREPLLFAIQAKSKFSQTWKHAKILVSKSSQFGRLEFVKWQKLRIEKKEKVVHYFSMKVGVLYVPQIRI